MMAGFGSLVPIIPPQKSIVSVYWVNTMTCV